MALEDYFDNGNFGPYFEFTGLEITDYRERHDENSARSTGIIDNIDSRIAQLESEANAVISAVGGIATASSVASRLTVNDFFAVSRIYDTKVNGQTSTTKKIFLSELDAPELAGDFIASRWPGWMINRTLIVNSGEDIYRVGVPIVFGGLPGAGLFPEAPGSVTGEPIFYQRLDIHKPIEQLRDSTFTLRVEYSCDTNQVFELFARFGPAGTPTTITGPTNSFDAIGTVFSTAMSFTVPDDADFVTVGLDFSQPGFNSAVRIVSIQVTPGNSAAATPPIGVTLRRDFLDDIRLTGHYWRRWASSLYGTPAPAAGGPAKVKSMRSSMSIGTPMPFDLTGQIQLDTTVEIDSTAGYDIDIASVLVLPGKIEDFAVATINFTSIAPFDTEEQRQAPHYKSANYDLIDSVIAEFDVDGTADEFLRNTPTIDFAGEMVAVHPPSI